MSHFYFAWVDAADTTFSDSFKRDDEEVYSVAVSHGEGEFPSMDIDLRNPKVGLLSAGRKQWAWLSWTDESAVNHPLFFGRLVGIPQSLQADIIRLTFIARPLDYEDQRQDVFAAGVSGSSVYDPIWISADNQADPDSLLETIPSLWHIDRLTGVVTTSDIIEGEDGTVTFDESNAFYDSLDVTYSESPASKCVVTGTVNWTQRGAGSFPIFDQIVQAFAAGHTNQGLTGIRGNPVSGNGMIAVIPGEAMVNNWPKPGTDFGGGWFVKASSCVPVGGPPPEPVLVQGSNYFAHINELVSGTSFQGMALRQVFDTAPGFVVQVIPTWIENTPFGTAHGSIDILWFPIWQLAGSLEVGWNAARPRQETISFTLAADVQPLLTDPEGQEIITITVGPADVDKVIPNIASPRYFIGARGQQSFRSLIARARAALLARARCVEVGFDVTFDAAIALSCRKNGVISDDRLPDGVAGGKIKSYAFTADGDSGVLGGHVVLGATVGRDGTVDVDDGTPEYCLPAYVDDYQEYVGSTAHIPGYTDLTYTTGDYPFDDDGVVLTNVSRFEYLEGVEVDGTIDEQQPTAQAANGQVASAPEVIARVSGFTTTVKVSMRPISDNSFVTNITPTVSVLKVPKTIDTEAT